MHICDPIDKSHPACAKRSMLSPAIIIYTIPPLLIVDHSLLAASLHAHATSHVHRTPHNSQWIFSSVAILLAAVVQWTTINTFTSCQLCIWIVDTPVLYNIIAVCIHCAFQTSSFGLLGFYMFAHLAFVYLYHWRWMTHSRPFVVAVGCCFHSLTHLPNDLFPARFV